MRSHSFFLKSGKGTYGKGHTQITVDDIYINHGDTEFNSAAIVQDPLSPNRVTKIWSGSQRQYDAIGRKDPTTLYFIIEPQVA